MLVLSRKEDQKVVIPGLDIAIKVIRCKNSTVTLGFEAPPEIRIMRDELDKGVSFNDPALRQFMDDKVNACSSQLRHEVRDQFNVVAMALQMLLDDIDSGSLQDIDEVFDSICKRLSGLRSTPNDSEAYVLVVDDDVNERELLAGILRMNGYRVATACDGVEALEYLASNGKPAFILVDLQMPRCDGAELVQKLCKSVDLSGIRVYIVSGADKDDFVVAPDCIDGWYSKPLEPQKLINAMLTN